MHVPSTKSVPWDRKQLLNWLPIDLAMPSSQFFFERIFRGQRSDFLLEAFQLCCSALAHLLAGWADCSLVCAQWDLEAQELSHGVRILICHLSLMAICFSFSGLNLEQNVIGWLVKRADKTSKHPVTTRQLLPHAVGSQHFLVLKPLLFVL